MRNAHQLFLGQTVVTHAPVRRRAWHIATLAVLVTAVASFPAASFAQVPPSVIPPEAGAAPVAQPPAVTLPPELDRVLRDYESAWRDGDGARLASLFVEDGFAIQSGRPVAHGRAAIRQGVSKPGGALQLSAFAFATSGDSGHIVGAYRYPQSAGPGGRFVLVLRKGTDGVWRIVADLDNAGPSR